MAMTRIPDRFVLAAAGVVFVAVVAGCGSGPAVKTFTVKGTVVNKRTGQPMTKFENGVVVLEPVADTGTMIARGTITEDGTFTVGSVIDGKSVAGLPAGDYRVRIVPVPDAASGRGNLRLIDPKYLKFETSGLRLNVLADMTDVRLEVEVPK